MILLVNDDGIAAPGLRALYRALRRLLKQPVVAVAPVDERSGQSHAITINRGMHVRPVLDEDFFGFQIEGTPTDCLKLALKVLLPQPPKLVVSGINDGPNVGRSLFYSGTIGAALEAAVEGQSAIAFSRDRDDDGSFEEAAEFAATVAQACLGQNALRGLALNVNIPGRPANEWQEPRACTHGLSGFEEGYRPQRASDGKVIWSLAGKRMELAHEGETDAHLLRSLHPTITLLQPNLNATRERGHKRIEDRLLDRLQAWSSLASGGAA